MDKCSVSQSISSSSSGHRRLSYIVYRIFARAEFDSSERNLVKILNLFHLLFLGMSCTIGSGAYSIIGLAAQHAGPSILISFFIVGVLCFFTCFPYAEFASKIPSAGFAYSYVYSTSGELLAYLVGWGLHCIFLGAGALSARCLSSYLASAIRMTGLNVPVWLHDLDILGLHLCPLGAFIVLAFCLFMLQGMQQSTIVNNIASIINLCTLLFAIFIGISYAEPHKYYTDFFPFGGKGMFAGMSLAFFAYLGFENLACFTEEAIHPERDIPISLTIVLLLAIFVNGGLAMVMMGVAPLSAMNTNESLVAAFMYKCPTWISVIISCGSIAGLTGTVSAALMSEPRIFYSMAVDRLIPPIFIQINQKTQVPEVAVLTTCGLGVFITLFFDVQLLGNIVSLNGLLISSLVDIAVVVARYDSDCNFSRRVNRCCALFYVLTILCGIGLFHDWPLAIILFISVILVTIYIFIQSQIQINIPRNFSCPCVPLVPLLGAASFLLMSGTVEEKAWLIFAVCNVLAIVSYALYGYRQSKLNRYRKESLESVQQIKLPEHLLAEAREKSSLSEELVPEAKNKDLAEIEAV